MTWDGRCDWCGSPQVTSSGICTDCGSQMVFISPSWTYDEHGNVKEDPGWHGPAKFLPARYRTEKRTCLV